MEDPYHAGGAGTGGVTICTDAGAGSDADGVAMTDVGGGTVGVITAEGAGNVGVIAVEGAGTDGVIAVEGVAVVGTITAVDAGSGADGGITAGVGAGATVTSAACFLYS